MKTTVKLSFMMSVEWFIWDAWFVPLWLWLGEGGFGASEIGWSYACTAIVAILSPILVGSITDRFFSTQEMLAVSMFVSAILMCFTAQQTTFSGFFPLLLAYSLTYMPAIALTNSIAFANIPDVERDFPRIRVMGAIGWIASGLACGFLPQMFGYNDISLTNIPLLITAGGSTLSGVFAFFLSDTPLESTGKMDFEIILGLDALILLRGESFLVLFFCSFLFAIPLAFYYIFASGYLTEVSMKNVTGWMTLGQFSEILFMLALPFFTRRFGIKKVLLLSLIAATVHYGFFVYGGAEGCLTYALLFLGVLLYGVGYDFYYVTAYIHIDKKTLVHVRTAAQGLITLCYQGFGSLPGYRLSGVMMGKVFAYQGPVSGPTFDWTDMWGFSAAIIVVITVMFMIFFRESDKEITAIKMDGRDVTLKQGEIK